MELPQLGKQCAEPNCKQLDFLSLNCKCGKVFCKEHFNIHVQTCVGSKQLTEDEVTKITDVFKCSQPDCNITSIVPLICEKCNKHFCIKHRHIVNCGNIDEEALAAEKEKYAKPVRDFEKAKAAVDKQIEINLTNVKKREKQRQLANKIQLMKIKNRATGLKIIPTSNRIYFNIQLPESYGSKTSPVFVSNTWTLGRVTDAIAKECNVQNNNNIATEKKLRLFRKDTGQIVSNSMSCIMEDLLKEELLMDGDNLILEYVDESCLQLELN